MTRLISAKDRVADGGDHEEAHHLGRSADLTALEEQQRHAEDGQSTNDRLEADAGEHSVKNPGQATEEESLKARIRENQCRRRLLLEGIDQCQDETAQCTDDHEHVGQGRSYEERDSGADNQGNKAGDGLHDDVVVGHPAGIGGTRCRLVVHLLQLFVGHVLLRGRPSGPGVEHLSRRAARCLAKLLAVRVGIRILRNRRCLFGSTEILSVEDRVSAKCHCGCPPEKG
jgi:hypothetical protein